MYDELKKYASMILVSVLVMAVFVPINTSGQAAKPEWSEGDTWAMGFEKDLEDLFSPAFDQIENETQNSEIEDLDYNMEGKIGFYQIYEVTEASDSGYTLDIEAGGGVQISGDFEATGEMPEEGTHNYSDSPPMETKTISGEGEVHYSHDIQGTAEFDSDYALETLELEMDIEASGSYSAENIPSFEYDYENGTQTVEYSDYDGSISGEVYTEVTAEFDPALDIFDFPIEEGEEWTAHSNVTMMGSYEGEIDASGVPESMEEQMEEQGYSFPIVLEDLDTDSDEVKDGEIDITEKPVDMSMQCTGTEEIVLEDGSNTEAYVIESGEEYSDSFSTQQQFSSFQLKYSPEENFIVSQSMNMGTTAGDMVSDTSVQMEPMNADDARDQMESMQHGEQASTGLMGSLLSPPLLYILVGAIGGLILVALLLTKSGKGGRTRSYERSDQEPDRGWEKEQEPAEKEPPEPQENGMIEGEPTHREEQRGWSKDLESSQDGGEGTDQDKEYY